MSKDKDKRGAKIVDSMNLEEVNLSANLIRRIEANFRPDKG